jgi:hypothetical protein
MDIVLIDKYSYKKTSQVNTVMNLLRTGKEKSLAFVVSPKIAWLSSL